MLQQTFDDWNFFGKVNFKIPPDVIVQKTLGESIPKIFGVDVLICVNASPQNITNLTGSIQGQMLAILGDGFTTLKNGARIVLGSDHLLVANKFYNIRVYNDIWYPANG